MNIFFLSGILTVVSNFAIAIFVLSRGWRSLNNRLFSGIAISVGTWGLGACMFSSLSISQYNLALFWWQVAYTGAIYVPVFFSHFIFRFLNLKRKYLILIIHALALFFLLSNWYNHSLFFLRDLRFIFGKFYWIDWSKYKTLIWLLFYICLYWVLLSYSFLLLIKAYKPSGGIRRNQLKYFIVGSIVGWIGAEANFLPAFRVDIYPYLNFFVALYPLIIAYAMIKYRLMDITVAITRAGIFIAVYTLVLGIPFALAVWLKAWLIDILGPGWWLAPLGLMAVLATAGPFIYIYVSRQAEERLLAEQKRYQNTLKHASIGMTSIRNLQRLLNLITHIVTKTVKISYAAVYLYHSETDEYILQVSRGRHRISLPKLPADNPMIAWLMFKREPLIYEEAKRQMEDTSDATYQHLEENMRLLAASVLIPIFLEDKFMGFIVLGDKLSGQIYTEDDLNVFQVLASQAALAIENAQFYDEAQEMQSQIAQAEKMATIGTMADGLSHQINNRFYALSLIAGDTIDTIKLMDTTKCTPEVKEMIDSVSHALDRIQANVMQGGEVVKGIMKYTRKGEEKFEALTLDQIIDGTLDMVKYKVKLDEFDLLRDFSKDIPKVKGNLVQLQEVFFNFIDNAYDAIVERRTTLKEDGFRGKITFSTLPKGEHLEIVVEDNGMGMKEENLKKIFTPFFTTKISARKGTGLGLYVINKIITDGHKGSISFDSVYQSGTRFVVELPIFK
ncbi:MAG: ATP-binding protein [Candidatus Omnitrophica bacterium]|jgi:signal transduction histidine kinase|nr:ATP-binding protein [Candidatus Omnitrophota bacterium]